MYGEDVGWFDPDAAHTYDICPRDPYGNHESLARGAPSMSPLLRRASRGQD